jgi:DNA primase
MTISEQIKEKLDIVDVLSSYIKLTKAGINFKGSCPFHKEKTPSFMVSPEKQIWHCFGCNEGGDIFKFIMKYENLDFREALEILAKQAGIELKKQDPKIQSQISKLYQICENANDFFQEELKKNTKAIEYLQKRGLKLETIKEWKLGFVENKFNSLFQYLSKMNFKPEEIIQAGLCFQSNKDKSKYFDRFRGRIIFPIFDNSDRIVGFTGRIFGREENEKEPKYLNSPETDIFNKRRILYGFSKNKKNIREKDEAILLEGQMDVLSSWQNGLKNVIASSGTALSEEQLKILKRISDNLIIGYDMDEAGQIATERAIDLAKQSELNVHIISLPENIKDFDEYFLSYPMKVEELLKNKEEAGEYYYKKAFQNLDNNNLKEKEKKINFFLSKINKFNQIEKSHWLSKLSNELNIKEIYLIETMKKISEKERDYTREEREEKKEKKIFKKDDRKKILSDLILCLALKNENIREKLGGIKEYFSIEYQNILEAIIKKKIEENIQEKINYLDILFDFQYKDKDIDLEKEFEENVKQLKKEIIEERKEEKYLKIKELEKKKDKIELEKELKEMDRLSKELNQLLE